MRGELPGVDDVGAAGTWVLPVDGRDDLVLVGRFIGVGTSRHARHADHDGPYATRDADGEIPRCGACRWFETRIFTEGRNHYVLHHTGVSRVPGEVDFHRYETARSPFEVIELYTVRRDLGGSRGPFLTKPAARALAQAATHDRDLEVAYVDRAVS